MKYTLSVDITGEEFQNVFYPDQEFAPGDKIIVTRHVNGNTDWYTAMSAIDERTGKLIDESELNTRQSWGTDIINRTVGVYTVSRVFKKKLWAK